MNEIKKIMPVEKYTFKRGQMKLGVDARDLYNFLESKRQFADWIKDRLSDDNGNDIYEKGKDYSVFHNFVKNPKGGRPQNLYVLSLETAKRIGMMENNIKGQQIRDYFIECEKRLGNRAFRKGPYGTKFIFDKNLPTVIEREEAKESFNGFSDLLGDRGNCGFQKRHLIDYMHKGLRGLSAAKLRKKWGLKPRTNLRDHSSANELWQNRAAEANTAVIIINEGLDGYEECVEAVKIGSSIVGELSGKIENLIEE